MKRFIVKLLLLINVLLVPWQSSTNAWFFDAQQSTANRLSATSLDFALVDQQDTAHAGLFFQEPKFKRGHEATKTIIVKNLGQLNVGYWPEVEFSNTQQATCEQIKIKASLNGSPVFEGLLTEFSLATNSAQLAQANHRWDFGLTNTNETANLNGTTCGFALVFKGFQNPQTQTGFSDTETLTNEVTLAHQPLLTADYNQGDQAFSFTLTHLTSFVSLDYQLSYDSDMINDVIIGSLSINVDPLTKTILLGSCSSEGACTYLPNPHNFSLTLDLTDSDGDHLELTKEL